VATLRAEGDYTDWYCSMGEGLVDEQVLEEIQVLGWELVNAAPLEDRLPHNAEDFAPFSADSHRALLIVCRAKNRSFA